MASLDSPHRTRHEEFSLPLFLLTVVLTAAGLLAVLKFAAPELWQQQLAAPWWKLATAFTAVSLLNCFFEYFFHRYVLHLPAIPGLQRFYRQHTLHHALTRIARRPTADGRGVLYVENKFPIVEAEQGEGSFFPWYTLGAFTVVLSPAFLLAHVAAPGFPWFLGGILALATSITLYEVFHAINHWPFEKWSPLIEHPKWGGFWRRVYTFHLRHHAVIDCNESVSGFFGLPIADWIFGTCLIPRTIYADGEEWQPANFVSPRPRLAIRHLDQLMKQWVEQRRNERANTGMQARPPRVYSRFEEIANWLTHGIGAVLSAVALALLIIFASTRGDAWHVVSFTVFGVSLLTLYTASTLYHLSRDEERRRLLRRIDQAAIFLLIAGTYTPFLLTSLRGPWGWSLLAIIWTFCGAGALLKFYGAGRLRAASIVSYLVAGWLIVVAAKPMIASVPHTGLWLLLAGGICYTVGVPFYLWRQLRFHHAFWHGAVMGGSTCHFLAVLLSLTPEG